MQGDHCGSVQGDEGPLRGAGGGRRVVARQELHDGGHPR